MLLKEERKENLLKNQAIVIHAEDNVATVVDDFSAGTVIQFLLGDSVQSVQLLQDTPLGHKCAIRLIEAEQDVTKYGEIIGKTTVRILPGGHVHVHNMESQRGRGDKQSGDK